MDAEIHALDGDQIAKPFRDASQFCDERAGVIRWRFVIQQWFA
ncbi:hypothetical protein [Ovoidimarina sediminis]|nr:hypothetical protein [Rhodophyticola sp. MJ-SS7]